MRTISNFVFSASCLAKSANWRIRWT